MFMINFLNFSKKTISTNKTFLHKDNLQNTVMQKINNISLMSSKFAAYYNFDKILAIFNALIKMIGNIKCRRKRI